MNRYYVDRRHESTFDSFRRPVLLYGVEPTDAATFTAAAAILVLATGAASFLPAWRAAGIDPAEILKAE
jgi:ABC-type lipoprotein release transport system permease subunit